LLLVGGSVEELDKVGAGSVGLHLGGAGMDLSLFDSERHGGGRARAARSFGVSEDALLVASGLFASELAFGFGAEGGSLALPSALGLLAKRRAVGLGGSAGGAADGGTADSLASRATGFLAHFLGATNRADRFLTVDLALSAL